MPLLETFEIQHVPIAGDMQMRPMPQQPQMPQMPQQVPVMQPMQPMQQMVAPPHVQPPPYVARDPAHGIRE